MTPSYKRFDYAGKACGFVIGMISALVMLGWFLNTPLLVQIHPTLPSMQFNTALCFFILSICLFCVEQLDYRFIRMMAALVGTLAFVTMLEYVLKIDFGIDTFFASAFANQMAIKAGRMSPNAALNFTIASIAFWFIKPKDNFYPYQAFIIALIGSLVIALGIMPLIGYVAGIPEAANWFNVSYLALHTAFCFILLGCGLIFTTFKRNSVINVYLPIPVFIGLSLAVFYLSHALKVHEEAQRIAWEANSLGDTSIQNKSHLAQQAPGALGRDQQDGHIPLLILIFGIFFSFITSLAIYFALQARKTLEALYASEERLYLAISGTSDGLWDWQVTTGEVYYSPRFMEVLGYEQYELPQHIQTFYDLLHPDDRVYILKCIEDYFRKRITPYAVEYRLKHKNGSYLWFNARGKATWDDQGNAIRMTGFTTDITANKHVQTELIKSKEYLQGILDASHHSIISVGLDGKIQLFNKAAEKMLGYDADEVIGKHTPTLIHDQGEIIARAKELSQSMGREVKADMEVFIANLDRQEVDEREWTYIRKDGSTFPVWLSISVLHNELQEVIGYVGIAQDISERKALDAMKNEFVSIVSHELRTPLTSIIGSLSLLLGGVVGNFNEHTQAILRIAQRNSERLLRLINDILDIEKIEAGKMVFNFSSASLNELLLEAIKMNQAFAEKYTIQLQFHNPAENIMVNVDTDRFMQVLTNLISNAIKFSPLQSSVILTLTYTSTIATIAVIDHGPGITAHFQRHIFEKFSQADATTQRKHEGTGLGLNISKAIVDNLGGRIYFKTKIGEGSTFFIELPREGCRTIQT